MNQTQKPDNISYYGTLNVSPVECIYHEGQHIQHFCRTPECSLPMCPECVKIHSEEHAESRVQPDFELFQTCLHEQYYTSIDYLNKWGQDVQETFQFQKEIEQLSERQIQRLYDAKQQFYRAVDEYFRNLETQIIQQQQQQIQSSIKEIRAQHRIEYLDWEQFRDDIEKLNSKKCLSQLIKIYKDKNNSPQVFYIKHHNNHIEELNKFRNSIIQITVTDNIPQVLALLKQYIFTSNIQTTVANQQIQTVSFQQPVNQQQFIQQQQNLNSLQVAQSQAIQNQTVNKYQSRVIQPFSIMREYAVPPVQPVLIQPAPIVPIEPICLYPQQQIYQTPAYQESLPYSYSMQQQSTPPQIIKQSVPLPVGVAQQSFQPKQNFVSPTNKQIPIQKETMTQRYYDQMLKGGIQ